MGLALMRKKRTVSVALLAMTATSSGDPAAGIHWTTIRYDDPFVRGFEYVPLVEQDLYGPINELWV